MYRRPAVRIVRASPGPRTSGLAVALLATLSASCAVFKQLHFEQPTVKLDAVEITGLDLSGVSFILWLDVYNPNDYEIRATRVEAELDLEQTRFGTALLEESVEIAPTSHTLVKIPAQFTWEGVGAGVRALIGRGSVNYELDTKLRVKTSLGGRTLSFKSRGKVPIRDIVR
ncbi:MAG: LEA type 2 family protein [Gemmatimonadota bacterium]|jgi:LEA14-like dessication related protein